MYRIATNYCLNEIRDRKLRPHGRAELPERPGDSPRRCWPTAISWRESFGVAPTNCAQWHGCITSMVWIKVKSRGCSESRDGQS